MCFLSDLSPGCGHAFFVSLNQHKDVRNTMYILLGRNKPTLEPAVKRDYLDVLASFYISYNIYI